MRWRRLLVVAAVVCLGSTTSSSHAQIYRWDNGQVIPGTEGIKLGPGVNLEYRNRDEFNLRFADLAGGRDLAGARFRESWLHHARFNDANLSNADFSSAIVDNADFTGATISGASLHGFSGLVLSQDQFYSTASYQLKDLKRIVFGWPVFAAESDLSGWNFDGQSLTDAIFTRTRANQASFAGADLTNASFYIADLSNANLQRANLAGANLQAALIGADFSGANVSGSLLFSADLIEEQLYSTASYQSMNLQGIHLGGVDLSGWDFSGQNLINSVLSSPALSDTDFAGADTRGATGNFMELDLSRAVSRNAVLPTGRIEGLELQAGETLRIVDDDGVTESAPNGWPVQRPPIPVAVQDSATIGAGGTLQLFFESDPWGSLISFEPGIPVQLSGTLELTFTDDTPLATQVGRTIKTFDWTGVTPQGQFTISPQPGTAWDTSKLYTTGEVTLLGISSDLNGDKDVDSEDLLNFIVNWTGVDYLPADKTWQQGDSDADGDIDSADVLVFLSQWTGAAAAEGDHMADVPEPSGGVLAGLACIRLMTHSRQRKGKR